jgi:PRTRC genetic system ThiF family protein
MRVEHLLPPDLLSRKPVRILVVGAGGTGSAVAMGLPYLDQAMRVWGHPYGLEVALMDADTVTETNCVRQPFSVSDIGLNKATVLINRVNLFWGTKWSAEPSCFHERSLQREYNKPSDLLIGCVDTRSARKAIESALTGAGKHNRPSTHLASGPAGLLLRRRRRMQTPKRRWWPLN